MKHTKVVHVIILALVFLLTLSACGSEHYTVEITPNGGSVVSAMIFPREIYDEAVSNGTDFSEFAEQGYEISFFTEEGTEYAKMSIEKSFDSLEQLSRYLNQLGASVEVDAQVDPAECYLHDVRLEADKQAHLITMTGGVTLQEPDTYQSCIVVVKFPGAIVEHNIGTKTDDSTLEIDLLAIWSAGSDVSFAIQAELPASNGWLYTGLGLCVILGVGGFLVYKKRKSLESTGSEETTEAVPDSENC